MFTNTIEFPPIKAGKESEFLEWFKWSNSIYKNFDGYISRRLLKLKGTSKNYNPPWRSLRFLSVLCVKFFKTTVFRSALNKGSQNYVSLFEHESEKTFMAMHTSKVRQEAFNKLKPLLDSSLNAKFYQVVFDTV